MSPVSHTETPSPSNFRVDRACLWTKLNWVRRPSTYFYVVSLFTTETGCSYGRSIRITSIYNHNRHKRQGLRKALSMSSHTNVFRKHGLIQCFACSYTKHSHYTFTLELKLFFFCYRHHWWALWTDIKDNWTPSVSNVTWTRSQARTSPEIRWPLCHLQSKLIRVR